MSGHLPPFQLDGELSMQLSRLGAPVSSKKGTLLFRRGDSPNGAYLLMRGEVKLSAGAGTAELRRSCQPGCLLGLPATVRNQSYSLTAECLADCECVRVSHEGLIAMLGANKEFCLNVVEILANEVGELRSRLPERASSAATGMPFPIARTLQVETDNN